ncbi:MAG: hypothetical protein NTU69_11060 [Proteobacteria bacterium]|nr:hypothetical protein [Pseudomonadota bacterium]
MSKRNNKIIRIWYPHPFSIELREWVIDLKPGQIHKLVIQRLRARTNLIHKTRDILLSKNLSLEEVVEAIQSTIHLVERLTIKSPTIEVPEQGNRPVKLLSDESGEVPYYGSFPYGHPTFLEKFDLDVRWNFVERFLKDFYNPTPRHLHLLDEQDDVVTEFKVRKDDADYLRSLLQKWEAEENRIQIAGTQISFSRKTTNRLTEAKTPTELSYLILAAFHQTNTRNIKEMLHRARQEKQIVKSWSLYDDYIHEEKSPVSKLIDLLTS